MHGLKQSPGVPKNIYDLFSNATMTLNIHFFPKVRFALALSNYSQNTKSPASIQSVVIYCNLFCFSVAVNTDLLANTAIEIVFHFLCNKSKEKRTLANLLL